MQLVPGPLSSGAEKCLLRTASAPLFGSSACSPGLVGSSVLGPDCGCGAFRGSHPSSSNFSGEVFGSDVTGCGAWGANTGVRARQTSPTLSWWHCRPQRREVLWGLQEDQPRPRTKNGYSTYTSTSSCRRQTDAYRGSCETSTVLDVCSLEGGVVPLWWIYS